MADVKEYKCPSCGSPMHFDIDDQSMVCRFCEKKYDLDYVRSNFKEDNDEKLSDFDWVERTKYVWEPDVLEKLAEYSCSSCGGNIITSSTSSVAKCPFCNHDVIISSNFAGDIRPDKVIPFKRHSDEFAEKYREFIANSRYAPKEFKDEKVTDNIVGCYIPIWLYSCTCDTVVNDMYRAEARIKDYPILATDIKKNIFYAAEPFNYKEAENFTESCLTGFYANRYSIGAEHAIQIADDQIKGICSIRAASQVEGDFVPGKVKNNTEISDKKLLYYLVPIWLLNVKYGNSNYTFAMNGQTGEFVNSDVPYNRKYSVDSILIFVAVEILSLILAYLFVKEDYMSVAVALLVAVLLVGFMITPLNFIITYILHRKFFKKSINGLGFNESERVAKISDFIDGEIKVSKNADFLP